MLKTKSRFATYILLLIMLLTISCHNTIDRNIHINKKNNSSVVGIISTKSPTYEGEERTAMGITKMLKEINPKAKIIIMDYQEIVNFDQAKKYAKKTAKSQGIKDKLEIEKIESQFIKSHVENFIKDKGITRILIPGNYWNISSHPLPLVPYRQLITNAIVEIVERSSNIKLMGICGGLQGVMDAQGVEIVRVEKIIKDKNSIDSHVLKKPDPRTIGASLHKISVDPNSKLGKIVMKYSNLKDSNGWIIIYFPDAHSEAINMTPHNIEKLLSLGYRIVGYSEDGIIEALEDRHGNIHFQNHPEYLAIDSKKKYNADNTEIKNASISASLAIMENFLSEN